MTRFFDIVVSSILLIALSPLMVLIALSIMVSSPGGIFYVQQRVGFGGKDFGLLKFRTMYKGADKKGLLTIGNKDNRITSIGYYLRKYKLDELPQLINVLIGNMSIVGPRPEVRKYVNLYSIEQQKLLTVKPGITDYASIRFRDEAEQMAEQSNPEQYYIQSILPIKLGYSMEYISRKSIGEDIKIIWLTFKCMFARQHSNRT